MSDNVAEVYRVCTVHCRLSVLDQQINNLA